MFGYSINTYANSEVNLELSCFTLFLGVLVFHGMTHT
jgi:hypothetical protein